MNLTKSRRGAILAALLFGPVVWLAAAVTSPEGIGDSVAGGAFAASAVLFGPPLLCMGLTLFAELGFGLVQVMLGVDAPVSVLIVRDMLLKSVYAFFLGWPTYLLLRRVLRPALVEEPKASRRRQPTVLGA